MLVMYETKEKRRCGVARWAQLWALPGAPDDFLVAAQVTQLCLAAAQKVTQPIYSPGTGKGDASERLCGPSKKTDRKTRRSWRAAMLSLSRAVSGGSSHYSLLLCLTFRLRDSDR